MCSSDLTAPATSKRAWSCGADAAAIRHADLCLIPARPSVADIEAATPTLGVARAWNKPFAFVLNQTPIRGQRVSNAATVLSDEAALDGVLALPYIVMRNDHQDALGLGLAVVEYAPTSKSADEICGLWQWVEAKLNESAAEQIVSEYVASPEVAPTMYQQLPAETAAVVS